MNVAESQVESLFFSALEIQAPAERAAFLDGACRGNPELRQRVEQLLQAHPQVDNFLHVEPPASGQVGTVEQPVLERPGTVIGPYKLLQQIGEGGMGTVFMAEQTHPVQRKVAIKVIKPGMDSRQIIARFEAERQALAMMDHVNIARVLDAGATETGRPYFVMELVHGVPITKYCDDNHLTPRERLELFVPVCQAIQHAHQKGIIHRDIKPTNVMVTLYDGKPVPKVIDFGVAKATEQKLTERTLFTQYGTMVGTPQYMSPEQAEMSALGVDTRSDIYSLGVLLYELLTGSTPFTTERFKQAAYDEIRRIIREEEPPKPSTRLSALSRVGPARAASAGPPGAVGNNGDRWAGAALVPPYESSLASIAAQRKTEPAKLSNLMRGELDWIVMKTLEKDPQRRYETANALAADVQRYLADEPVQACPPSARYRFQKFARKNKGLLTTLTAVVAALLIGTVISLWQAGEAIAARKLADERFEKEKQARQETEIERQRAEANYERARAAVDQMLTRVAIDQVGAVPEMKELRQKLLEDAIQFYTELLKLNPRDAHAYFNRAKVFAELFQKKRALADFEKAVELEPDNVDFLVLLGHNFQLAESRDDQKALLHYQHAVELAPDAAWPRFRLAHLLVRMGRVKQGKQQRDECLQRLPKEPLVYHELSRLSLELNELQLALECAKKGGNYAAALADLNRIIMIPPNPIPAGWHFYKRRAKAYFLLGDYPKALADVQKSMEINPDDLSALISVSPAEVAACPNEEFRKGVFQLIRRAIERKPESAEACNRLAWLLATHPDPNFRDATRAVELASKAVELKPQNPGLLNTLGVAQYRAGNWPAAIEALSKSEELAPGKSTSFNAFFLALAHWQLDHKEEARKWYDQAVEWMEKNQAQNEELRRFRAEAAELLGVKEGPK